MKSGIMTSRMLVAALASVALLTSATLQAEDPAGDAAKIQGIWAPVRLVDDGKDVPPSSSLPGGRRPIYFAGDRTDCRYSEARTFRLDSSGEPKRLRTSARGPDGEFRETLFYRLERDTLTICSARADFAPVSPKTFDSKPGSGQELRTYKRLRPATGRHADDAAIRGTWQIRGATTGAGANTDPNEYMIPLGTWLLILDGGKYEARDESGNPTKAGSFTPTQP